MRARLVVLKHMLEKRIDSAAKNLFSHAGISSLTVEEAELLLLLSMDLLQLIAGQKVLAFDSTYAIRQVLKFLQYIPLADTSDEVTEEMAAIAIINRQFIFDMWHFLTGYPIFNESSSMDLVIHTSRLNAIKSLVNTLEQAEKNPVSKAAKALMVNSNLHFLLPLKTFDWYFQELQARADEKERQGYMTPMESVPTTSASPVDARPLTGAGESAAYSFESAPVAYPVEAQPVPFEISLLEYYNSQKPSQIDFTMFVRQHFDLISAIISSMDRFYGGDVGEIARKIYEIEKKIQKYDKGANKGLKHDQVKFKECIKRLSKLGSDLVDAQLEGHADECIQGLTSRPGNALYCETNPLSVVSIISKRPYLSLLDSTLAVLEQANLTDHMREYSLQRIADELNSELVQAELFIGKIRELDANTLWPIAQSIKEPSMTGYFEPKDESYLEALSTNLKSSLDVDNLERITDHVLSLCSLLMSKLRRELGNTRQILPVSEYPCVEPMTEVGGRVVIELADGDGMSCEAFVSQQIHKTGSKVMGVELPLAIIASQLSFFAQSAFITVKEHLDKFVESYRERGVRASFVNSFYNTAFSAFDAIVLGRTYPAVLRMLALLQHCAHNQSAQNAIEDTRRAPEATHALQELFKKAASKVAKEKVCRQSARSILGAQTKEVFITPRQLNSIQPFAFCPAFLAQGGLMAVVKDTQPDGRTLTSGEERRVLLAQQLLGQAKKMDDRTLVERTPHSLPSSGVSQLHQRWQAALSKPSR